MSRSINLDMCYRWLAWKVILKKQDTKQLKCVVFSLLLSVSCSNGRTCCSTALVSPLIVIALRWAPRCDLWSWPIDPLITAGQFMTCEGTLNQRLRMSPNPLRLKSGEAEMIAKMSRYVCRKSSEGGSVESRQIKVAQNGSDAVDWGVRSAALWRFDFYTSVAI